MHMKSATEEGHRNSRYNKEEHHKRGLRTSARMVLLMYRVSCVSASREVTPISSSYDPTPADVLYFVLPKKQKKKTQPLFQNQITCGKSVGKPSAWE